ncbi:phospholipase A2 isoform X3 [Diachasmimorpha longicaudata]|uniref:phospholipase A2 isoform X3 n=1 Tax=Diachasmimorpha longicaudata TaxID=58733 RepID=UPI0030B8E9FF
MMFAITFTALSVLWLTGTRASVLVADNTMSRMIELNAGVPFCSLYTDRGVIQKMILGTDPKKVRQMSMNLVTDLEETCKAAQNTKQTPGGGLIYPGTKWCGPGTLAKSYNELGHHAAEDACCREHDHCPIVVNPHQCIKGICNKSPFTRSHCDCDAKFRRCLQNLNTEVANTLGALFFNVVQVTCFKERRPCSQWQSCELAQWERSPRYMARASARIWRSRSLALFKIFKNLVTDTLQHHHRKILSKRVYRL